MDGVEKGRDRDMFFKSVVLNGNLTTMVLKFRRRRLKNIHGLRWKVDGVEKGRDKDMSF